MPRGWSFSTYSWAAAASSSGNALVTTARTFPDSNSAGDFLELTGIRCGHVPSGAHPMGFGLHFVRLPQGRDQDAARAQHLPGSLASLAADEVENHIDIGYFVLEALSGVIDDLVPPPAP